MERVDVLIVGAGLSGIGAACHLRRNCKRKSVAILEARDTLGGTWDLFRYPGARSDSDMFTLGYAFRPWMHSKAVANRDEILRYIRDTAREHDIERLIRYRRRVVAAKWSTSAACWTVCIECVDTGQHSSMRCAFLYICSGYYHYDHGYAPDFPDRARFVGPIIHPQHWPQDFDFDGKRVVIIGSGATAVTLAPAMATSAAHVTILQRSPTYVVSRPSRDPFAQRVLWLPAKVAYALMRFKNVLLTIVLYQLSRRFPQRMKARFVNAVEDALPAGFDVRAHFTPSYNPWDQRVCLAPDGDLFAAIGSGQISIATDDIARFTDRGILLASGEELPADVIVTATGLRLLFNGGIHLTVDSENIEYPRAVSYKGMMLCGVPNLAYATGYTNASWTLKADLVSAYVCRLLNYMDKRGYAWCVPTAPDPLLPREPMFPLRSGYVLRSIHEFPKQGTQTPWRLYQNYFLDLFLLRFSRLRDKSIRFFKATRPVASVRPTPADGPDSSPTRVPDREVPFPETDQTYDG